MTYESELAKQNAINFEAKKDGLRQMQDGGVKLTLNVNPVDMPPSLYTDMMGQRYMVVMVAVGDDDSPRVEEKKKSHAGEAKLLAQDSMFKVYCNINGRGEESPELWMKNKIGIKSCSELIEGSFAYDLFKDLRKDFQMWKRAEEQENYYNA